MGGICVSMKFLMASEDGTEGFQADVSRELRSIQVLSRIGVAMRGRRVSDVHVTP